MSRVLVVSPGVLPIPPVLGGAVENLIARLHPALASVYEMEYVSVGMPDHALQTAAHMARSRIHYVDSINPLCDFTSDNQFELSESDKCLEYAAFCGDVVRSRAPTLIHVHNEAYLVGAVREAARDARIVLHVNDEVVTRLRSDELESLAQSCDLILACSAYISRAMTAAFHAADVTPPPIEVFYNFVDITEYDPARATSDTFERELELGDGPVVLFVGRMIEQKGPHLLLRAFARIAASNPDARLVFVGAPWYSRANDSSFVDLLKAEASRIKDQLRFTGYVDHARMPDLYAAADIVCAPSIWDDPSPFVTYEAQAMAKPVIASQRGGIPEIVEDHVTGRCIDVFNTPLFAQVLNDWLDHTDLATEIGRRGRARMTRRFTLTQAQEVMTRIYTDLIAGRNFGASERCVTPATNPPIGLRTSRPARHSS